MPSHEYQIPRDDLRWQLMGAQIRAAGAREYAREAIRKADRAVVPKTIGQCLNGGLGWLQVSYHRCKTEASIPLDCIRRQGHADLEARGLAEMPVVPERSLRAAGSHNQADGTEADHALCLCASGRGDVRTVGSLKIRGKIVADRDSIVDCSSKRRCSIKLSLLVRELGFQQVAVALNVIAMRA